MIQSCVNAFTLHCKNHSDIEPLGSQAMSVAFGGESTCSLVALCYGIFMKIVASAKSFVMPERLPPTDSATTFHDWDGNGKWHDPLDWGWRLEDNQLVPMMSDMNAAPDTILKIVNCNCTTGCSGPRCSCRKHGLLCTSACGSCQLTYCDNQLVQVSDEREDSDDYIKTMKWGQFRLSDLCSAMGTILR